VELAEKVVVDVHEEDALASIGVGHALPENGLELDWVHGLEVEISEHVFFEHISVLLKDLDLVRQAVVHHAH